MRRSEGRRWRGAAGSAAALLALAVLAGEAGAVQGRLDGDFERGAPGWCLAGGARPSVRGAEPDGYWGLAHLVLEGDGAAAALCDLAPSSRGAALEARVWASADADEGASRATLELWTWDARRPWRGPLPVARAAWMPSAVERGTWRPLVARSAAPADPRATHVLLGLSHAGGGTLRVDLAEVGPAGSLQGTPPRVALANYVGWYRSPLWPGAPTTPAHPQERWRNWRWVERPGCGGGAHFAHDPDCASGAACLRANGRRDVAVGSFDGDDLPLAGAYDSRDPHVLRYHGRLARAIGLDGFVFLHQGHTLALQEAAAGREPLIEQAFEALLDAVETPGVNLKLAVMYEPKVHFLGWVAGEPTKADKKAGIAADLAHLVATYGHRRGLLKRGGEPVVFVFRNDVCDPTGAQCMSDADWRDVLDAVRAATGREPLLVADTVPLAGDAFGGISRWELVALPFLRFRTFADALAGLPTPPAPAAAALRAHADMLHALAAAWVQQAPSERLLVGLAWPGFDDSGVAGWGAANLRGEDGLPLCVRVADPLDGAFFDATLESALASGAPWLQVATWNDWNERTHVEPRWDAGYAAAALAGGFVALEDFERVFERALACQRGVAELKGLALGVDLLPGELHAIAAAYLRAARFDPAVTEYD